MALRDLFKKKETPKVDKVNQAESAEVLENQRKEAFLKENYRKALTVALAINRLRSNLPEIMKSSDPEQLRNVNDQLERIEAAMKGATVATEDLENNDSLAIDVITNLSCLLADPRYATYRDEGLNKLQEALTEDWFQQKGMLRLQRKLALVIALENMVKAEIEEMQLTADINAAKAKISTLMGSYDANADDQAQNAEILMLNNRIKFMENQLIDTRNQRIEESNLLEKLRFALKKLPAHSNPAVAGIYESLEQEQAEQLTQAIERVQKIRDKLIRDKVKLEMAAETIAEEGIVIPPDTLQDIREMIKEHNPGIATEQASAISQENQNIPELEA